MFKNPNAPKKDKPDHNAHEFGFEDGYISSDEDVKAAERWKPAPLPTKQGYGYVSKHYVKSDIISSLVNIYGS